MTDARPRARISRLDSYFNRAFGFFVARGLGPKASYILAIHGRRSGEIRKLPVFILDHAEKRYLVAPRGITQWVCNARQQRQVELSNGKNVLHLKLRELADREKPEILQTYLRQFRASVQRFFTVPADAPVADFAAIAAAHPVFELLNAEDAP